MYLERMNNLPHGTPTCQPLPYGTPLMYERDDCIPAHMGTWKGAGRRGTAPLKLLPEPGITERHFVLPLTRTGSPGPNNLLTMVLSEFEPLGRALESEPKINALLSPSSLSLYVGQVCPGSSDS